MELQNCVLQNISSTAQERYVAFLEQYPLCLPNTQIASYLGITPEFLSKIRSELKQWPYLLADMVLSLTIVFFIMLRMRRLLVF